MRTQVIAHGVAVFNHPLRGRQDQDALAQTAQPGPIEFPFDRINRRCGPTSCTSVVVAERAVSCWRVQVARYPRRAPMVVENSRDLVVMCPR